MIALLQWYKILSAWMMPWNVSTHWNLRSDMLIFALEYKAALIKITGEKEMNPCQYKLSSEDWDLIGQLCDALRVC